MDNQSLFVDESNSTTPSPSKDQTPSPAGPKTPVGTPTPTPTDENKEDITSKAGYIFVGLAI